MTKYFSVRTHHVKVFQNNAHGGNNFFYPDKEIEVMAQFVIETAVLVGQSLFTPGDAVPSVSGFTQVNMLVGIFGTLDPLHSFTYQIHCLFVTFCALREGKKFPRQ
jgi:hypothetical protein